jgi:hypothetical protein
MARYIKKRLDFLIRIVFPNPLFAKGGNRRDYEFS